MYLVIELAQKLDGFEVLVTTLLVRQPFTVLAGIVEVQHGGHGIHSQRIDVECLDPVKRTANEVVDDLAATVVEDQGAPVAVLALARVFVFVKCRAVKTCQAVFVLGKVCRHPIHDHADAGLVAAVDEVTKLIGCTKAVGGRVHPNGLVAPGAVERMLRHRQ